MTITIHCVHCNQALAIAPRRVATRLECPSCGRGVAVPAADPNTERGPLGDAPAATQNRESERAPSSSAPIAAPSATPPLRRSPSADTAAHAPATPARLRGGGAAESPAAPTTATGPTSPPIAQPPLRHTQAIVLSRSSVTLALIFALAALAAAFCAGFFLAESRRAAHPADRPEQSVGVAVPVSCPIRRSDQG